MGISRGLNDMATQTRSRNASRRRVFNQRHEIGFSAPRMDRAGKGKTTRGGKRGPGRVANRPRREPRRVLRRGGVKK